MTAVAFPVETPKTERKPWFTLSESRIATSPAEARGISRDRVRMLVSFTEDDSIVHTDFTHFPEFLSEGDVVVVNESATVNAALEVTRKKSERVELHLSQRLYDDRWVVELRKITDRGTKPLRSAVAGETLELPDGATARLIAPHGRPGKNNGVRLWLASVKLPQSYNDYLNEHGFPITYTAGSERWPLTFYQTIFARVPGSAEMPSAGRPFTRRIVDELVRKGVKITPILLNTGVSSLEHDEPPYAEYFRVHAATARIVNEAHDRGNRVLAVGTTVVRALETSTTASGRVVAAGGWTGLVITPDREMRSVDAMLTGFHEPTASHLAMLEALAGHDHIERAYTEALSKEYLWHEFGDVHLILPERPITPI